MENEQRAATTRDSEKYIVRLPDGMRERIKRSAEENNRSMNAEIVARLTNSLNDVQDSNTQAAMLAEIYFLLDTQRQELLTLHKQSMDELVQAANTPPGERQHLTSKLPEPTKPSTAGGIARLRPAVNESVRTTHPFLKRSEDSASEPKQTKVPIIGTVGENEAKTSAPKSDADRLRETAEALQTTKRGRR